MSLGLLSAAFSDNEGYAKLGVMAYVVGLAVLVIKGTDSMRKKFIELVIFLVIPTLIVMALEQ